MSKHDMTGDRQDRSARLSDEQRRLVEENLGLVYMFSQKYAALPFWEDVFQEACIGLILAAQRFDPRRGYTFATYATRPIRQAIRQALATQFHRLSTNSNYRDLLPKLGAAYQQLAHESGHVPTAEQVAERMDKSVRLVKSLLRLYDAQVLSLERPLVPEEDLSLAEILEDDPQRSPEGIMTQQARVTQVHRILAWLSPRERTVITLRYGFLDEREWTYEEIAAHLGVGRITVSEIERRALFKLRRPAALQGLHDLLD